jgi:hypothetical protein
MIEPFPKGALDLGERASRAFDLSLSMDELSTSRREDCDMS